MEIRFNKLKLGDKFVYQDKAYLRIQNVYAGCCSIVLNCKRLDNDQLTLLNEFVVVEKIEEK